MKKNPYFDKLLNFEHFAADAASLFKPELERSGMYIQRD